MQWQSEERAHKTKHWVCTSFMWYHKTKGRSRVYLCPYSWIWQNRNQQSFSVYIANIYFILLSSTRYSFGIFDTSEVGAVWCCGMRANNMQTGKKEMFNTFLWWWRQNKQQLSIHIQSNHMKHSRNVFIFQNRGISEKKAFLHMRLTSKR